MNSKKYGDTEQSRFHCRPVYLQLNCCCTVELRQPSRMVNIDSKKYGDTEQSRFHCRPVYLQLNCCYTVGLRQPSTARGSDEHLSPLSLCQHKSRATDGRKEFDISRSRCSESGRSQPRLRSLCPDGSLEIPSR